VVSDAVAADKLPDPPPPARWSAPDLADAVEAGLRTIAAEQDAAQDVYGFDARDELALHPLLRRCFADVGYGVWPEVRYPSARRKRSKAEGNRCDLVLTPARRPLRQPDVKATLFDDPRAVDESAACWVEIKTVAQFEVGGPFRRYSAELHQPVAADVRKLWADGVIAHAALLLVLFTATREVAEHDLPAWYQRCLDRKLPVGMPALRGLPLNDRIGNGWCGVGVFPVRGMSDR
jgi:hypothetical protein